MRIYQADAFTDVPFGGNPAAVCLVEPGTALSDALQQSIAAEMNLSETAFLEPVGVADQEDADPFKTCNRFRLRWFTPNAEVALCGHATLAAAAVLLQGLQNGARTLLFDTLQSGQLAVHRTDADAQQPERQPLLQLDMPLHAPIDAVPSAYGPSSDYVQAVVGSEVNVAEVVLAGASLRYLAIVLAGGTSRQQLEALKPDLQKLKALQADPDGPIFGIIVTAAADDDQEHDFLSRFWAPWALAGEDPVTGSAHAVLGPYWQAKLGKQQLTARQCSARGGELTVDVDTAAGRVRVAGRCSVVMSGQLHVPLS